MDPDVTAYVDAIDAGHRPLFDRVDRLVKDVRPEVEVVLAYKMPTYVAGSRRLHVGVWKHGLSFYGWEPASGSRLVTGRPHLDNGKGTFRLPLDEAEQVTDAELREFLAACLTA